jgi:hypothetical protein
MKTTVALLVPFALATALNAQPVVDYRFDEVKRKVVLTTPKEEFRVDKGQLAHGGDKVQTGMFSYALIASERYRARFEIFASTDVKLAVGTPGVILSLDRGRLRAIFDKITGNEPRVVQTPGALLAVRGTQYDVSVDKSGRTTLDVLEGVVEIRSDLLKEPLLLRAGERSTFSRREPPVARPMPPRGNRDNPSGREGDPHGRDPRGAGPGEGPHGAPGNPPGGNPPKPPPGPTPHP